MKKSIFFLFILLHSFANGKDYTLYHNYINLAEYHLVNNRIDSVFYYYDKAFSDYDYIFVKDALIAAQVAWKLKDAGKTRMYLLKGAESGLRTDCINKIPILASYTETKEYNYSVFDSMKIALGRFESFDVGLSQEWHERGAAIVMTPDGQSEFMGAVQQNVKRVRELLSVGKFPGEKFIGVNSDCFELENLSVFNSLANYDCVMMELRNLLWEAVKRGEMHPREFATLWEWEYVRSAYSGKVVTSRVFGLGMKQHIDIRTKRNEAALTNPSCDPSKIQPKRFRLLLFLNDVPNEEINANRREFLICELDTDDKKWQLQEKEGYKLFWTVK
jgi:hypothetical protein